jgi:hypothetical protein
MHARNPTAFSARAGNLLHNRKGSGSLLISAAPGVAKDDILKSKKTDYPHFSHHSMAKKQ